MNSLAQRIDRPYFIYKWTNLINKKIYIGMTCNPNQRLSQYKSAAKLSNDPISKAHRKYGFNNFTFELINYFENFYVANEAEKFYIKIYNSRNIRIGYNLSPGGCSFVDAKIGQKISKSLRKYYLYNKSKNLGRKHTAESKEKISKASIGKPGTNKGKKFNDEWRAKIAKANTGKKPTIETLKKLSDSHKGKMAPNRKLTMEQVREIRKKYKNNESIISLAKEYGLSDVSMGYIVKNLTYKEISHE